MSSIAALTVTCIDHAWHVTRPDGYRLVIGEPDRSRPGVWKAKVTAYAHDTMLTLATIDVLNLRDRDAFNSAAASANGQAPVLWDEFLLQAYCAIEDARGAPHGSPNTTQAGRAILIQGDTIQVEAVTHIWDPYLPRKMATIVDGDPGVGKTGLACLIAASVTQGYPLPDQAGQPTKGAGGPANVLMVAMEDHLGAVIAPRLHQCGADLSRITFVNDITDAEDNPRPFTLTDLPLLTDYLERVRPQFVYVDAIQAVLGGKADINRANVVTALLAPLKKLAEQYECAVLCSRHPAKPGQNVAKVLYRGMGSQAFVGTVRSGLFVEEHPGDFTKAIVVHYKANTGKLGRTQLLSKAEGNFEWAGASRITHRSLAGDGSPGPLPQQRLKAALWLETRLKPVGIPASALLKEAEDDHDFSPKVLRAAADCIGVTKSQVLGDFLWSLSPLTTTSGSSSASGRTETSGGTGGTGVDWQIQGKTDFFVKECHEREAKRESVHDHPDTPDYPDYPVHPVLSREGVPAMTLSPLADEEELRSAPSSGTPMDLLPCCGHDPIYYETQRNGVVCCTRCGYGQNEE